MIDRLHCKNNTYPNGVYQTGYTFPNGKTYASDNTDPSVIEFIGGPPDLNFTNYSTGFCNYILQYIVVAS